MTDSRKPAGKHLKKDAGLKVAEILTAALGDLKEMLGEKKFHRNIKKASKAMVAGLSDKKDPAKPKKKAAAKKAVTKKTTTPKAETPKAAKPETATKKSAPKKAAAKKA
ncbi:MAG: hypothetical protein J7623_15995 [Chitinophaga sp.]|uniref:hypothetical protein n=1 Tax=Chitinophaga sp. TaxID=1869181 RepID=UPI001B2F090E|nr:hypothetical protein [Chitinophaga sp.]MBO9730141.1 hypothetical protein [Chitinophaga sp.]